MNIHIDQIINTDLLIVGGGIGGLSASVEAYENGIEHVLISKAPLGSGASFFPLKATLGIQVSGEPTDHELFRDDIARVACGMNNPKIVKAYIEESAQAIELLAKIGFQPWKRNDNRPACFAKYPRPIYLINKWKEAAENAKRIIAAQQARLFENATLLYIATHNNQVQGALFSHKQNGEIRYVFCQTPHIILASGGIAGLYQDNLYPADIIGSTHFVALRAGARLTNLEFIQFIPSFIAPKYKVLFGEHTLKYCTSVTDQAGKSLFPELSKEQFAEMMRLRSDYAPFSIDFPCVNFDLTMMKHLLEHPEERGVYIDYAPALYQDDSEFYKVYLDWLKQEVGIDLLQDNIAIAPFAHSCNGGIEIDEYAESTVNGLFAVGEVSSCIEGANRLGGNSVGGSLVFAKRAVAKIAEYLHEHKDLPASHIEIIQQQAEDYLNGFLPTDSVGERLSGSEVLSRVRQLMAKYANLYRTEQHLAKLLEAFNHLERALDFRSETFSHSIEIYHALQTAKAVAVAMLTRTESRGAHYRADYPQTDKEAYRLRLSWNNGQIAIDKQYS